MITGNIYLITDQWGNVWKYCSSLSVARDCVDFLAEVHEDIRYTINRVERTKVVH